jgi:hypothetical protein
MRRVAAAFAVSPDQRGRTSGVRGCLSAESIFAVRQDQNPIRRASATGGKMTSVRSVPKEISLRERKTEIEARHLEGLLDEALDETFPASDPVAVCFAANSPTRSSGEK